MNIPAKYRTAWYWIVAVVAAGTAVAGAFDIIPADAVQRGIEYGMQIIALLTAILALRNITPDNDTEEYMAPYVEDAYKEE